MTALARSAAARVFMLAGVLTLISAWPLVRHLSTALPADLGDPVLETWLIWWNAHVTPLTAAWWNAPMFVPMQGATALSESLLGLAPLTTPLQWLGFDAVAAHNIAFLLSTPMAALAAYALASRLTTRQDAAIVAALAFAFAPYRLAQMSHLQVLWSCWMPLALAALHDFIQRGTTRSLVFFGVCWSLNGFTNGYYLAYFPVLVGVWMLWFVRRRSDFVRIIAAGALASLPWLPLLHGYTVRQAAMGLSRGINEIRQFSADLSSLLAGSDRAWLSSHWTLAPKPEGELYPGIAIIVIVGVGVWAAWKRARSAETPPRGNRVLIGVAVTSALVGLTVMATGGGGASIGALSLTARRPNRLLSIALIFGLIALARSGMARRAWRERSPLAFYVLAAALMFLLAMGPEPLAWGRDLLYRPPYWWLMQLPGFDSVRVPARFGQLMVVVLTQACGLAIARLVRQGHAAVWVLGLLIVAEGWIPSLPLAMLPPSPAVPAQAIASRASTLELPISNHFAPNTRALLNGLRHGQPMLNGFGGYIPAHYHVLRLGLNDLDASVLTTMSTHGPIATYVYRAEDISGRLRTLVSSQPGAEVLASDDTGDWILLPASAAPAEAETDEGLPVQSVRTGTRPDSASLMRDDDPMTRWYSDVRPGLSDRVELDFSTRVTVTQIEISLGPWTPDFPRDLEISAVDGDTVTPVWRGSTAGLALKAALESKDLRVRIAIPRPVAASHLRLTNVWREGNRGWSIAELRVFGRRGNGP